MKKYAIHDPATGGYSFYNTSDDLIAILANHIIDTQMRLTDNKLWSIVEENQDGSQLWRNAKGDEIPDPEVVKAAIAAQILAHLESLS